MRHVTSQGLALVKRFEGLRLTPYADAAGKGTIGYGHLLLPGEAQAFAGGITEETALSLLWHDLCRAERAVFRFIQVPLTDGQFDALVDFTFNLGAGALQRSTLRQKVNRGEHAEVPTELLKWCRAGGVKLPGLIRRRQAEGMLYAAA